MRRATRNNASGPLESLTYWPKRKAPVTEEERVSVAEEEGAATGCRGLGELEAAILKKYGSLTFRKSAARTTSRHQHSPQGHANARARPHRRLEAMMS